MLNNYKTLKTAAQSEITEKKSRFIAHVTPVTQEQQAVDFINGIKSKYYDATHNVYAYILKDNNIQRYSDDGEPAGTAGIPVLDVLRKEGITDACIVVARYFGGTLLGAGGLVRAYTKSAKAGVDRSGVVTKRLCYEYTVNFEYTMLGKVQNELSATECITGGIEYANDVTVTLYVPFYDQTTLNMLTDVTNGRAIIKKQAKEKYIDVD